MNAFAFPPPVDEHAIAHGAAIYARRDTGVEVPFREVELGGWTPVQQECHDNVLRWIEAHPTHSAVHGWLYMDFGGALSCVRLISHSVVRDEAGELFDITPMGPTFGRYPFISSDLDTDQYADIVNPIYEQIGAGYLHHYK